MGYKLTAVDYDPFQNDMVDPANENKLAGAKLTPVDYDPFEEMPAKTEPSPVAEVPEKPKLTPMRLGKKAVSEALGGISDSLRGRASFLKHTPAHQIPMPGLNPIMMGAGEQELMSNEYWGGGVKEALAEKLEEAAENPTLTRTEELKESSGWIEDVVGGVAGFGPTMVVQAVSPAAGTIQMYHQIQGSSYKQMIDGGADPDRAFIASSLSSLAQVPLESAGNVITMGAISKLASGSVQKFTVGLVKAMAGEGLEEYLQAYPDEIANMYAMNPDVETNHLVSEIKNKLLSPEFQKDAAYQASVGAGGGALMVGMGQTMKSAADMAGYVTDTQRKINNKKAGVVDMLDDEIAAVLEKGVTEKETDVGIPGEVTLGKEEKPTALGAARTLMGDEVVDRELEARKAADIAIQEGLEEKRASEALQRRGIILPEESEKSAEESVMAFEKDQAERVAAEYGSRPRVFREPINEDAVKIETAPRVGLLTPEEMRLQEKEDIKIKKTPGDMTNDELNNTIDGIIDEKNILKEQRRGEDGKIKGGSPRGSLENALRQAGSVSLSMEGAIEGINDAVANDRNDIAEIIIERHSRNAENTDSGLVHPKTGENIKELRDTEVAQLKRLYGLLINSDIDEAAERTDVAPEGVVGETGITIDDEFSRRTEGGGEQHTVNIYKNGKLIGQSSYTVDNDGTAKIGKISAFEGKGTIGVKGMIGIRNQIMDGNAKIKRFTGDRVGKHLKTTPPIPERTDVSPVVPESKSAPKVEVNQFNTELSKATKLHKSSYGLKPQNSLQRLLEAKQILDEIGYDKKRELYTDNERLIGNYKKKLGIEEPAKAKEPWEMSRDEWSASIRKVDEKSGDRNRKNDESIGDWLDRLTGKKSFPEETRAANLTKEADELQARARGNVSGLEPGQPIVSAADRNRREYSLELTRKAAEKYRQAEDILSNLKQKESEQHKANVQQAIASGKIDSHPDYPDLTAKPKSGSTHVVDFAEAQLKTTLPAPSGTDVAPAGAEEKETTDSGKSYQSWDIETDHSLNEDGVEIEGTEYALIDKIYVDPSERRKGVGSKLLEEAISEIKKEHGNITIKVAALPFGEDQMDTTDLVEWYEKRGFEVDSMAGDAVVMVYDGSDTASVPEVAGKSATIPKLKEVPVAEKTKAETKAPAKTEGVLKAVKPKESKVTTLGGAIKALGGINFLNFSKEVQESLGDVRGISKKDGMPYDIAIEQLREDGWVGKKEDFFEFLRSNGQEGLKRGNLLGIGQEKQDRNKTDKEKQFEKELEQESEAPPSGKYITIDAEDLPEGKKITIIDGEGARGWDVYEVIEKDPFEITLKDGVTKTLSPLDRVEVRQADIKADPKSAVAGDDVVSEQRDIFGKKKVGQTDVFGGIIPEKKVRKKAKKKSTDRREAQLDIFTRKQDQQIQPALFDTFPKDREKPAVKIDTVQGRRIRSKPRTTGFIGGDGFVVKGMQDAASILAHIRKSSQEKLYTIAVDRNGIILHVHEYTKGLLASSQYRLAEIVPTIYNIPGVTKVYSVHNHPSGHLELSAEDTALHAKFSKALSLKNIKLDSLVMARTKWTGLDAAGNTETDSIKPSVRATKVPVKENYFTTMSELDAPIIDHPNKAIARFKNEYGDNDGIIFLSTRMRELGFMPMPVGKSIKEASVEIMAAAQSLNSISVVLNSSKRKFTGTDRSEFFSNLVDAFQRSVQVVDAISEGTSHISTVGPIGTPTPTPKKGESQEEFDKRVLAISLAGYKYLDQPKEFYSLAKFKPIDTASKAFKKWFGGSKVVDENGDPLVVYHGTSGFFDQFDEQKLGENTVDWESAKWGFAFTSMKGYAEGYSTAYSRNKHDPTLIEAYLSIENPKRIELYDEYLPIAKNNKAAQFKKTALAEGHDGIIVYVNDQHTKGKDAIYEVFAFSPTQIKSAISNTGEFSETDPRIMYQMKSMKPVDVESKEFKRRTEGTKVVDRDGNILRVFHGAKRPDRIGDRFRKTRATSGPMAFFTDDPEIASGYAVGKSDTSIENTDYDSWFKVKVGRGNPVGLSQAWYSLPSEIKQKIKDRIPHIVNYDYATDEELDGFKYDPEEYGLAGKSHWDYTVKQHNGNYLAAARDVWLDSGGIFREEEGFMDILKLAGMDMDKVIFDSPYAEFPAVFPVYLVIKNPLDTGKIPKSVVDGLQKRANRQPAKKEGFGDPWAKDTRDPQVWMNDLTNDVKEGTTYAWTSIPDWVTRYLKILGYDGIKDTGGKYSHTEHNVWIPFDDTQVISAISNTGDYSETDPRYQYQLVHHGTPHVWPPEPGFPHGRPRIDKIGTGEGGAAFGWGWYSAQEKGTGQFYFDVLESNADATMRVLDESAMVPNWLAKRIKADPAYIDEAIADWSERVRSTEIGIKTSQQPWNLEANLPRLREILSVLEKAKDTGQHEIKDAGSLYTLDIPDDVIPKLLDWDAPLSEQPEIMKRLAPWFKEVSEAPNSGVTAKQAAEHYGKAYTGSEFYWRLANRETATLDHPPSAKAASEYLASIGIPGNKYLDGFSRNEGEGSYNYVIWDQKVLDSIALLERNGEKLDAIREQYQLKGGYTPITAEISLNDIKSFFKGQAVGRSADNSVWVKTTGGNGLHIDSVAHISADASRVKVTYGRMQEDGEFVAGKYQSGTIELQRDLAGKLTLKHESVHWMEDTGIINDREVRIISNTIKKAAKNGDFKPQNKDDIGGVEDRATFVSEWLEKREKIAGPVSRVLKKIADFIDGLVNLVGIRTARGVVKDIESGKIFGRKGTRPQTNIPAHQKTASRWYSQMENEISGPKFPNKGTGSAMANVLDAWVKSGKIKSEELEWSGLSEWLDTQDGRISKQDVLDWLAENNVRVEEVVKGRSVEDWLQDVGAGVRFDEESDGYIAYYADSDIQETYDTEEEAWSSLEEEAQDQMNEYEADSTKFSEHQEPGGENYKELLLTLPGKTLSQNDAAKRHYETFIRKGNGPSWENLSEQDRDAVAQKMPSYAAIDSSNEFTGQHYDEPNILAHVRFNERTGPNGEKILFLEELQGDWAQEGRKKGFIGDTPAPDTSGWTTKPVSNQGVNGYEVYDKNGDIVRPGRRSMWYGETPEAAIQEAANAFTNPPGTVPNAPFVKDTGKWTLLAMKRMVRYAAENGFDVLSWTPGDVQVDRYKEALRRAVDKVEWTKEPGGIVLQGFKNGHEVVNTLEKESSISDAIGKSMGDKIIASPEQSGTFEGDDITISDTGMAGFYDKILPSVANKFFNKKAWGKARVGTVEIRGKDQGLGGNPDDTVSVQNGESIRDAMDRMAADNAGVLKVHALPITPEMKKKALREGMPLFSLKKIFDQEESVMVDKRTDMGRVEKLETPPQWLAKKYEPVRQMFDRMKQRDKDRTRKLSQSIDETAEFYGMNKNSEDFGALNNLIWNLDGQKINGLGKKFTRNEDGLLIQNEDHYVEYRKWLDKIPSLSERVKNVYLGIRRSLDKDISIVYNMMDEMKDIDDTILEEFRKSSGQIHNYFPHMRYGKYYLQAYNFSMKRENGIWRASRGGEIIAEGRNKEIVHKQARAHDETSIVYREHYDAAVRYQAKSMRMIEELEQSGDLPDDVSFSTGEVTRLPEEVFSIPVPIEAVEAVMNAAIDRLENEEAKQSFRSLLPEAVSDALKSRGWGAHTIKRKGIPGFEMKDTQRVLFDYRSGLYGWLTKMSAARDFSKIMSKASARSPRLWSWLRTYSYNMLENTTEIDRAVNTAKAIFFAKYLGANIKTAILNTTQNIIAGWPRLGMEMGGASARVLKGAYSDISAAITGGKNLTDGEQRLLTEMFEEGTTGAQFLSEVRSQIGGNNFSIVNKYLMRTLGFPMEVAEKFNRTSLALAAYRGAVAGDINNKETLKEFRKKRGEAFSYEDAKEFATTIIEDAHFVYGRSNRPEALRSSQVGKLAQAFYTFRSFTHHLLHLWKFMFSNQRGRTALLKSLAATIMIGGVSSIPLYKTLLNLIRQLTGDDPEEMITDMIPEDADVLRDMVVYGAPSVTGFSLGGSIGMELPVFERLSLQGSFVDQVGGEAMEALGIPWAMAKDIEGAARAIVSGQGARAWEYLMPAGVANVFKGYRLGTSGSYTMTGRPINVPGAEGPQRLNMKEAIGKALGFQPIKLTKSWNINQALQDFATYKTNKRTEFANRAVNARGDEKKLRNLMEEFNSWNRKQSDRPEYQITPEELQRSIMSRTRTRKPPGYLMGKTQELRNRNFQEAP